MWDFAVRRVEGGWTGEAAVPFKSLRYRAGEAQVNLTRFSLFFPEKRDFFLENQGIYYESLAGVKEQRPHRAELLGHVRAAHVAAAPAARRSATPARG